MNTVIVLELALYGLSSLTRDISNHVQGPGASLHTSLVIIAHAKSRNHDTAQT